MGSYEFDEGRVPVTPIGEPNNGTQSNALPDGVLLRAHSAYGAAVTRTMSPEPVIATTDGGT